MKRYCRICHKIIHDIQSYTANYQGYRHLDCWDYERIKKEKPYKEKI